MQRNHLFIMDPIEKLNLALDTSLHLAFELSKREAPSYFTEIKDIFWESPKGPQCRASLLQFGDDASKLSLGEAQIWDLDSFSSIQMRKDPPFDTAYITATWFLDNCPQTLVVNDPQGLRAYNEKMLTLLFPKECKSALVSYNAQEILQYIRNHCHGDAIIKPLDLYGGRGIFRLQLDKMSKVEAEQLLVSACEGAKSARLIQAFDPHIFAGEVRVFTMDGEPLSWCLKIPHNGNFLANTRAGATLNPYKPSPALTQKVRRVAQNLVKKGVLLTGMDLINEEISEINITSPRLLIAPNDRHNYFADMADWLLKRCESLG